MEWMAARDALDAKPASSKWTESFDAGCRIPAARRIEAAALPKQWRERDLIEANQGEEKCRQRPCEEASLDLLAHFALDFAARSRARRVAFIRRSDPLPLYVSISRGRRHRMRPQSRDRPGRVQRARRVFVVR